jgi:PAS domain S-box-containing protein
VLIIDDEPTDREIFKRCLQEGHPGAFVFAEASTGSDGLRKMKSFLPDCVLLDFQLPDLDGLKMIRLLHNGRETLPCPVVMLTGIGSEQVAVEAMKLGVMDYMAKSAENSMALSRTVASAVQRYRLQEEIAAQRVALEQRNRELEAIRAELFDEKERYRLLAESIPQLVWSADSTGRVLYGNQRLWDFFGVRRDQAGALQDFVQEDDRASLQRKWAEAAPGGEPFECEVRLRTAHEGRWHLMRTVPIRTPEGGPVHWLGTFTDIEDQKRAEEAVRQRQKLDSIGLLAAGIAHDFNNLLVGIMGGASFAIDSIEKEHPAYPMLELVVRSSERAAHLTQQLLAYAGKVEIMLEPTDLQQVTHDACELVRGSMPVNIQLVVETEDQIPVIRTSAAQMQQVIVNLVMNAVEAIGNSQGMVKVATSVHHLALEAPQENVLGYKLAAGPYICLTVSDSGAGMDPATRSQIFDPFFTTKFTGRGLGLAAVQGIIRSLGGGIEVSSKFGAGSTFRVLLPAHSYPAPHPVEQKDDATAELNAQ